MLFGREKEFDALNTMHGRTGFRAICMYGKRKVGKTFILQEFSKDKKVVFFSALESSRKQNLIQLSKAIYRCLGRNENELGYFGKYEDAFKYMRDNFGKDRVVFIVDDFQKLLSSDKDVALIFKRAIDNVFRSTNMLLICCGSPKKIMLDAVSNEKSPLYKKFSGQISVEPFDYIWTSKMLSGFTNEEKAIIYGITGGVVGYVAMIDNNLSLKENIVNLILRNNGALREEPENIVKSIIREPAYYNSIIDEVAAGAGTINDISEMTDMDTATTSTYMKPLLGLEVIKKNNALTEENNRKKTLYKVEDALVAFIKKLDMKCGYLKGTLSPEEIYDECVVPNLNEFMQDAFREMCVQYLEEKNRQRELHFKYERIGRWWGKDKKTGANHTIPLYALNDSDEKALYGVCLYDDKKMDIEHVFELMESAKHMKCYDNKFYAVFSKQGFADDVIDIIKGYKSFIYVTLEDMYSFFE